MVHDAWCLVLVDSLEDKGKVEFYLFVSCKVDIVQCPSAQVTRDPGIASCRYDLWEVYAEPIWVVHAIPSTPDPHVEGRLA